MKMNRQGFERDGKMYGYPPCCIESFIQDVEHFRFITREPRKLSGTGFIPCAQCNVDKTTDEMVAEINRNREVESPFTGIPG